MLITNGKWIMQKNFWNKNNREVFVEQSIIDYYFQPSNNFSLHYIEDYDWKKIQDYDVQPYSSFSNRIQNLYDFLLDIETKSIDVFREELFNNSHNSFLYGKSMCIDIWKNSVHHPLGCILFRPSKINYDEEILLNHGFCKIDDDLFGYKYSGSARLKYFDCLGIDKSPVLFQIPNGHDIKIDNKFTSFGDFYEDYLSEVKFETQVYQEEKPFEYAIHEIPKNYPKFDDDKVFGFDKEWGISFLVVTDVENVHKQNFWNNDDHQEYINLIKKSIPFDVNVKDDVTIEKINQFLEDERSVGIERYEDIFNFQVVNDFVDKSDKIIFNIDGGLELDYHILDLLYFSDSKTRVINPKTNDLPRKYARKT